MPSLVTLFKRPEYFFRPRQVLQRLRRMWKPVQPVEIVRLPWGAAVQARLSENVGADIIYYGIFDRIVPEAVWRLLDAGETAADIGANIGQNTSAMAFRAGARGRVISFEPHPATFAELRENAGRWQPGHHAQLQLNNVALGGENGEAVLVVKTYFSGAELAKDGDGVKVPVRRLDDFLNAGETLGVVKIDVEGHELAVLEGAAGILQRRAIRDLIFEDFNPQPSAVVQLLERQGFRIFLLQAGWSRPCLIPFSPVYPLPPGFSYNYLATLQPERAIERFRRGGWRCLAGR